MSFEMSKAAKDHGFEGLSYPAVRSNGQSQRDSRVYRNPRVKP